MRAVSHWRFAAVLVTAAFFGLQALWIPAKAQLAQWLLERSWREIQDGARHAPPWPWADTQPAAVLEVPGHEVRQIVLGGASGRNLAFGPTLFGDLSSGDVVISGHRDTHFAFLQDLQAGDTISLETPEGRQDYEVAWFDVVDTRTHALTIEAGVDRLSLVTCYPFNTLNPGGPLRLVVTATPKTTTQPSGVFPPKHAVNTSL